MGFKSSWFSQIVFTIASSGMPRSSPHNPQTQPKNNNPTNAAVAFMRAPRLASHVASIEPTKVATRITDPAVTKAIDQEANCTNAANMLATAINAAPKYGTVWSTAAAMPQSSAYCRPDRESV